MQKWWLIDQRIDIFTLECFESRPQYSGFQQKFDGHAQNFQPKGTPVSEGRISCLNADGSILAQTLPAYDLNVDYWEVHVYEWCMVPNSRQHYRVTPL